MAIFGAVAGSAGSVAIVYGIHNSVDFGWTSGRTIGFLAGGVVLLGLFVMTERRAQSPILPLAMFRRRTLSTSIVVGALMWGSFFAMLFQASLYMQQVLRYSAIRTGLAYLAIALTVVVVSAGGAARVVGRFGPARILVVGQLAVVVGLLLLPARPVVALRAPVGGLGARWSTDRSAQRADRVAWGCREDDAGCGRGRPGGGGIDGTRSSRLGG